MAELPRNIDVIGKKIYYLIQFNLIQFDLILSEIKFNLI